MARKKKIRVDLRKNRTKPPRDKGWTRAYQDHGFAEEAPETGQRIRAKGDLSRRRTIVQEEDDAAAEQRNRELASLPAVDPSLCKPGRVLRVQRLHSLVETDERKQYRCVVRQVLRSLAIDERNVIAAGDRVWFQPVGEEEGLIQKIEPRHGVLTRASRGREHVIVANVDQVVIVMALAEPDLKPHLIDRYLASAEQGGIQAILCLNKADLVDLAEFQPLIGYYSQLGIPVICTSGVTGQGIELLRRQLRGRQTVFSGQSGVGKSSLLNALQPGLQLRVREVSEATQKGKHTTTTAELIRFGEDGWVVDTPGIRQFQLWNIIPQEVEGFFPEFRPFVARCSFPNCTHTHEQRCAVKEAVQRRLISQRRYYSYLGMFKGTEVAE